jgi:integrase
MRREVNTVPGRAVVRVVVGGEVLPVPLAADVARAAEHANHARPAQTERAYSGGWARFEAYAIDRGARPLPADPIVVAAYLAYLDAEGLSPGSLHVALAAISDRHRAAGLRSPCEAPAVVEVWRGIRATRGTAQRGKEPLSPVELRAMVDYLGDDPIGVRDRALLCLGFAGGFRRSELVALRVEDLEFRPQGLLVNVARSKTDQEGRGALVPIHASGGPCCPVASLSAWIRLARINAGVVFRSVRWGRIGAAPLSGRTVALIVKRCAARVGLDTRELAGHSLRAGFATTAAMEGASLAEIGRVTRHASEDQIRKYIRLGTAFHLDPLRGALSRG